MLSAVNNREVLAAAKFLYLLLIPQNFHIKVQTRRKGFKEVLVYFAQFLQREILQRERASLDDAVDLIALHVVGQDFYELEHFGVKALVVNFEMSRSRLNPAFFIVYFHRKKLL